MRPTNNSLLQNVSSFISKKIFAAAIATTLMTATAFANGDEANAKAVNNFKKEYKNARDVQWKVTKDYTKAAFNWHNQYLEVFYNNNGETIAESRAININDLPVKAQQLLEKRYNDYRVAEAIEFNSEETGLCYYISVVKDNTKKILKITPDGDTSNFQQ
jgi:2-oxoglutarate dehydrogenase complex dehydrogenase (E1) component-like enzyme